jgi:hypothetical protein
LNWERYEIFLRNYQVAARTKIASNNSCNDNKIRFPAPVPVDARVRGRAEVVSIDEKGGGWYEVVTRFTLEVEGNEKPCFVGDSVTRVIAP